MSESKNYLNKLKPYLSNLILIWAMILVYFKISYYNSFLREETYITIITLAVFYTIFGLVYYSFIPNEKMRKSRGELIFRFLHKILRFKLKETTKEEKISMLFFLVKIFFIPIMINFFINNFYSFKNQISEITIQTLFTVNGFNYMFFPFALTTIFLVDTLWFSFGYLIESESLKNTVRSVEPTFFGWTVALICYPPFNSLLGKYLGWHANDYAFFINENITFCVRIIIVLLLLVYVSATLALGAKSSNLTNRGIVSRGPYAFIRHPAYVSKNLAWEITIIPVLSWMAMLSMSVWAFIYHLRAITEERHLKKDPDYIEYCKKVKWRYIPRIY